MKLQTLLEEYGLELRNDEIYIKNSNQRIGVLQWYEKRSNGDVYVFAWNPMQNEPVTLILREDSRSVHIVAKQMSAKHRVTIYGELLDKLLRKYEKSVIILTADGEQFKGRFFVPEKKKVYSTPPQPSIAAVVWWLWGYIEDEEERKKHPRRGRKRRRY